MISPSGKVAPLSFLTAISKFKDAKAIKKHIPIEEAFEAEEERRSSKWQYGSCGANWTTKVKFSYNDLQFVSITDNISTIEAEVQDQIQLPEQSEIQLKDRFFFISFKDVRLPYEHQEIEKDIFIV
jgi:hypothetical protein